MQHHVPVKRTQHEDEKKIKMQNQGFAGKIKVLNVKKRIENEHELKNTFAVKIFIHIWCGSSPGSGFSIE